MRLQFCSRCDRVHARGHGYCLACHAAYMRDWRKRHPMTPEQRRKDSCRSYAGVYKRRGVLRPEPCEACGSSAVEMHHEDYTRPLDVIWLCRACHLSLHAGDVSRLTSERIAARRRKAVA